MLTEGFPGQVVSDVVHRAHREEDRQLGRGGRSCQGEQCGAVRQSGWMRWELQSKSGLGDASWGRAHPQ